MEMDIEINAVKVLNEPLDSEEEIVTSQREPYELADSDLDIDIKEEPDLATDSGEGEESNQEDTPKPYICDLCFKAFRHKTNLSEHSKIHSNGETPQTCTTAGRHKCLQCDSAFASSAALNVHIRLHTGERPYKCTHPGCAKDFRSGEGLKVHMRIHTGEKPYKCSQCPSTFADNHNLLKHKRRHTSERPYKCPHHGCSKDFREKHHMKRHIQGKHGHEA